MQISRLQESLPSPGKGWIWLAPLLLLVFAAQAIGGMWNNTATYDEVAHLPAGYVYVTKRDFRFNPEHPPLMKIIAALPLLSMQVPPVEENPHWNSKNEWQFGRFFLYSSGVDADRALFRGRLMIVLLAILLGIIIFFWSRELYGMKGALFSLFLFAFEPDIIANSQVIHTDLGFSLFMTLALYLFWRGMKSPSRKRFLAAGAAFGLALATKFTALLLLPIFGVLVILYFFEERGAFRLSIFSPDKDEKLALKLKAYFIVFAILLFLLSALIVLAASYGFFSVERYFDGLRFLADHNRKGNPAFLFGMYSDHGWWYYFPLAFLIKTPLPIILFFFASLGVFIRERFSAPFYSQRKEMRSPGSGFSANASLYDELHLLVPAFLIFFFSLLSRINIGVRHILPIVPLLIVFSGRLVDPLTEWKKSSVSSRAQMWKWKIGRRMLSACGAVLGIWLIFSTLAVFPHHISYFNEMVGGPANGYKYLVDSNLDWGQDLIRLKQFLAREGEHSVILSYFGSADPHYYGILYQYLPGYGLNHQQEYSIGFRRKEFIAVSATNFQSVFFNMHDTFDWLKERTPYARIGYSIFVWEISRDTEAHRHLARLYREFGMAEPARRHEKRSEEI